MHLNPVEKTDVPTIGLFDSGIGGLTVLKTVASHLPKAKIAYFGDTARLPYGNKSSETIIRYSLENAIFLIQKDIKILVVACNTASAHSLEKLQTVFNIPIIGVIEPAAASAATCTKTKRIGIIGTRGTIGSGAYQRAIKKVLPDVHLAAQACPMFVPLVEERYWEHSFAKAIIKEHLAPIKQQDVDTLVLGCTHYPLLKSLIQDEMGPSVSIVDPALACAETVAQLYRTLIPIPVNDSNLNCNNEQSRLTFFASDDPDTFKSIGEQFLGFTISSVIKASSSL